MLNHCIINNSYTLVDSLIKNNNTKFMCVYAYDFKDLVNNILTTDLNRIMIELYKNIKLLWTLP